VEGQDRWSPTVRARLIFNSAQDTQRGGESLISDALSKDFGASLALTDEKGRRFPGAVGEDRLCRDRLPPTCAGSASASVRSPLRPGKRATWDRAAPDETAPCPPTASSLEIGRVVCSNQYLAESTLTLTSPTAIIRARLRVPAPSRG